MGYIFRKRRDGVDLDHLTEEIIQYINNKIKKQKGTKYIMKVYH